jgi:hypothetical protein
MNRVRRETVAATGVALCDHRCTLGRCCNVEDVMGEAFWCMHLVAIRGALERRVGAVRERLRIATRGTFSDAILCEV